MTPMTKMLALLPRRQFVTVVVAVSIAIVVLAAVIMYGRYALRFGVGTAKLDFSPADTADKHPMIQPASSSLSVLPDVPK
jgi:hypothetical protein